MNTHEAGIEAIKLINNEVSRFKTGGDLQNLFPERWLPSAFSILEEPFTEDNGLINSTMKVVRGKVEEKYRDKIEHLYTVEGKNIYNNSNISSMLKIISN